MPTQLIKWEENKPFSMLSPLVQEVELDLNIRNALSTEKSQQYKNKSQVWRWINGSLSFLNPLALPESRQNEQWRRISFKQLANLGKINLHFSDSFGIDTL